MQLEAPMKIEGTQWRAERSLWGLENSSEGFDFNIKVSFVLI
jgi:hypothetical protein